ncbi:hypothetical protein SEUCBS140593_006268 [Sporothrix eucalyptigena]|uniref:Uncharacterized protein n=1 Tax=Sporothrix eucalyptigena TaxID=1812306 RepID=A0ABP0C3P6_9PEZI
MLVSFSTALCQALEGTFLDVSLKGLALIASNEDAPSGDFNAAHYPLCKSVQFCLFIDNIPDLRSLLRGDVKGMVLRASYSAAGEVNFGIVLPGQRTISFGDTLYTGLLELEIQLGTDITLALDAALNMRLEMQPTPLTFAMNLSANKIGVSVAANMISD